MDILGIDISKAKFDAVLLIGERARHAAFSDTEAGFEPLLTWLAKQCPALTAPVHACMEATGNWGLDLAALLHSRGIRVSVVNPVWPAFGRTQPASRLAATANSRATRPIGSMRP